jgi:acyl-CoA thioesterase-1
MNGRHLMPRSLRSIFALALLPMSASAASAQPATIVAFGDSNTFGMNMAREEAYPAQLEAILKAKGYDVRVSNAGEPGNTTSHALSRLDWAVPAGTRVAIVQFGVNDARRGVPPAEIEQNLSQLLARLKAKSVRLVLCGRRAPFPPGYDIEGYRAVYRRVGKQYGAAGCNFTEGIPPSGFHADGHENAVGTAIVARNLSRIVEPMIRDAKRR